MSGIAGGLVKPARSGLMHAAQVRKDPGMKLSLRIAAPWIGLALMLAGCTGAGPTLPPPPVRPNGLVLWGIIHGQCAPDQRDHGQPAPCVQVSLRDGEANGFVVLKDRSGVAQHLLMPTARITGIEDAAVLRPGAPNYFAQAWQVRHFVEDRLGRPLARDQMSIAVNSQYGRSQDQLHLHIDCLDRSVAAALRTAAVPDAPRWSALPAPLKGRNYRIRWIAADRLEATNPFKLLAETQPGARAQMGAWTLALVGAERPGGRLGFYLLADRIDPATGDKASAEDLQDHACKP